MELLVCCQWSHYQIKRKPTRWRYSWGKSLFLQLMVCDVSCIVLNNCRLFLLNYCDKIHSILMSKKPMMSEWVSGMSSTVSLSVFRFGLNQIIALKKIRYYVKNPWVCVCGCVCMCVCVCVCVCVFVIVMMHTLSTEPCWTRDSPKSDQSVLHCGRLVLHWPSNSSMMICFTWNW